MVKAVLMGLAVYWLTLARMPKSIMNYLRRAIFNFLWGSSAGSYRAHLVDWHSLSKPYGLGGWNSKHLDWFNTTLRLKSLWLVLNGNGIWSHIIKFKYLKGMTVDTWLHVKYFRVLGTSYIWNGFVKAMSLITCHLGWKVGNGCSIRVGVDSIASLNSDFVLPEDLKCYLEDYGITTLNNSHCLDSGHQYWLTAIDLDIEGSWKEAWTKYIRGLSHGGIQLNNNLDSLVWLYNKKSGMVTASLAYEMIAKSTITDCTDSLPGKIWKHNLPLKIICF